MSLPRIEVDLGYVSKLDDNPNDVGGLDAAELKAVFDKAGLTLQEYINTTLIPQIERDIEAAALGIGGGGQIGIEKLPDKSIGTLKLEDGSVTTPILADGSVTGAKVVDGIATTKKIADNAVTTAKIADNAVTREKIPDQAISAAKIFPGAVLADKIANKAITASKIATDARTQYFPLELTAEGWTGDAAPYSQSVAVEGILEGDLPKVYFSAPEELEDLDDCRYAFSCLYEAEAADNTLIFRANEVPEISFDVLVEVARI